MRFAVLLTVFGFWLALAALATEPLVPAHAIEHVPTHELGPSLEDFAQDDAGDTAEALYAALVAGRWLPAIGLGLMLVVWGARNFGGHWIPWLCTQAGGRILAIGAAGLFVVGVGLASGKAPSFGLFAGALGAAWTASGQWTDVKDARKAGRSGA